MESLSNTTDEKSKKDPEKKVSSAGEDNTGRKVIARAVEAQTKATEPREFFKNPASEVKPDSARPELAPDASLSKIDVSEKQIVERRIVAGLRAEEQMAEQVPEADPAMLAAAVAVERFRDKIEQGLDSDDAEANTLEEIPVIASEILEDAELTVAQPEIDSEENLESDETPFPFLKGENFIDTYGLSEGEIRLGDTDDDGDETPPPAATPAATTPPASSTPAAGSSGGSGGQPPHTARYVSPGFPGMPDGFNVNPTPAAIAPNQASDPSMVSVDEANYYARRAETRGLLIGGIIGYLIGRRRGRIKTRKKLLPIQKKLEKEVKNLQDQIVEKEAALRVAAVEQVRAREANAIEPKKVEKVELQKIAPEVKQAPVEKPRTPALEANQLHGKKVPLEKIGHVLIAGEAIRAARSEIVPVEQSEAKRSDKLTIEKQVTTMTRAELLGLSEKIVIDNANLRQIYETHLVGERGLRRIVTEYLRGGDYKRALRRELIEREIDFERDPILRDKARASASVAGKSALKNLLQQSGALPDSDEDIEVMEARQKYQASIAAKRKQRRRVADVSLITTIVVLIALVVLLIAGHH